MTNSQLELHCENEAVCVANVTFSTINILDVDGELVGRIMFIDNEPILRILQDRALTIANVKEILDKMEIGNV